MKFITISFIITMCWTCTPQALQAQTKSTDTFQIDASFIEDSGSVVPVQDPNGFLWGLKDSITGKLVLPYRYHYISPFVEGRAIVVLNGFCGYINAKGEEIVSPNDYFNNGLELVGAMDFNKGYAVVRHNRSEKENLINYDGKLLFTPRYDGKPYSKIDVRNMSILKQRIVASNSREAFLLDFDNNIISTPIGVNIVRLFPNGLYMVKLAGQNKFGFWDWNGNEIPPMVFDKIETFSEGIAVVKKDGKWGCIDESGKELFYTDYDYIEPFYNGFARVTKYDGEFTYKVGNVDTKGKNRKMGYINKLGKEVVPLNYTEALGTDNSSVKTGLFVEGFAPVRLINNTSENRQANCGFIDTTGKPITPFKYSSVEYFKNGLAKVRIGKCYGFINYEGKEIIPIIYDLIVDWYRYGNNVKEKQINDTYILAKQDSTFVCLDLQGRIIASYNYDKMEPFIMEGKFLSIVTKNKKKGLIDVASGKIVIPIKYDVTTDVYGNIDNTHLLGFSKEAQFRYFNINGIIVKPSHLRGKFYGGIAQVENKEKYGLINLSGKLIVPCIYDAIDYFRGGMAVVKKNEKYGFIDYSGKLIIPTIYDNVEPFEPGDYYTKVVKNEETFEIDRTGKIIEDDDW